MDHALAHTCNSSRVWVFQSVGCHALGCAKSIPLAVGFRKDSLKVTNKLIDKDPSAFYKPDLLLIDKDPSVDCS